MVRPNTGWYVICVYFAALAKRMDKYITSQLTKFGECYEYSLQSFGCR